MSDGGGSDWKTVRVRKQAWEQAQEQRQEAGRTWSEQIVRGENAGGLDVDALEDRIVVRLAREYSGDLESFEQEVGKAVELAEQARDNTDEIKEKLK